MKVYVAAKPSGAVVGVYTSLVDGKKALNDVYFMGESQIKGLWVSPSGAVIQSFELEGVGLMNWPPFCLKDGVVAWDFSLEPEQLRPRGATINVTINYESLNLEVMVKEAVEKAIKVEQQRLWEKLQGLGSF